MYCIWISKEILILIWIKNKWFFSKEWKGKNLEWNAVLFVYAVNLFGKLEYYICLEVVNDLQYKTCKLA